VKTSEPRTDSTGTNVVNSICTSYEWGLETGDLFNVHCEKNELHNVMFYLLY